MGKSKEYLKKQIAKEVTQLFESVLDYSQVACVNNKIFKVLRSRILRVGNDCIRNLHTELDSHYDVQFNAKNEDIIEVTKIKR